MSRLYALKVRKSDLALITLLNDGIVPEIKKTPTYIVFQVSEDGKAITSEIVTERKLMSNCEILNSSPLLLRIKDWF